MKDIKDIAQWILIATIFTAGVDHKWGQVALLIGAYISLSLIWSLFTSKSVSVVSADGPDHLLDKPGPTSKVCSSSNSSVEIDWEAVDRLPLRRPPAQPVYSVASVRR